VGAATVPAKAELVAERSLVIGEQPDCYVVDVGGMLIELLGGDGFRLCAALGLQAGTGWKMVFICGAIDSIMGLHPALGQTAGTLSYGTVAATSMQLS
jgi:hypothetical protein